MHIEPMGEGERRTVTDIGLEFGPVDIGLQLVRDQHHDDIRPPRGIGDRHHPEPLAPSLLRGSPVRAQSDGDFLHPAVAQVERMRVSLAAIADNRDFLALDDVEIGIPIVIDAH